MAQRAVPLLLLLAAVVVVVAAAPAHGEIVELGSRRWLQEMGAVAPAEGPSAADSSLGMGYISYGALSANTVPCSERGQSYYNCQPGADANPYTRGCSAIALCRG
ncbi:hypothetical protein ACQ4PT_031870 [Festuca glaucescens]